MKCMCVYVRTYVCVHVRLCVCVNYKNGHRIFCYINTSRRHSNKKSERVKRNFLAVKAAHTHTHTHTRTHTSTSQDDDNRTFDRTSYLRYNHSYQQESYRGNGNSRGYYQSESYSEPGCSLDQAVELSLWSLVEKMKLKK